jgi:hypothetical protein
MTAEIAALLRAPFPPDVVGKLPRIWCGNCRNSSTKACDKHRKVKCQGCRNNITEAHLHLDYIGHAEATDRLLQADPLWSWEPFAVDAAGLPAIDAMGGLWIRLTVAGVTRIGYGDAGGKKGTDAVKEIIGDAIRNAAMRFGVALDLWGATFKEDDEPAVQDSRDEPRPTTPRPDPRQVRDWAIDPARTEQELRDALTRLNGGEHPDVLRDQVVNEHGDDEALRTLLQRRLHDLAGPAVGRGEPPPAEAGDDEPGSGVSVKQHAKMHVLWNKLGYAGDANRDNRLKVINTIVQRESGPITSSKELTRDEAKLVIDRLDARLNEVGASA